MGGKVQAMPGFADHVAFIDLGLCMVCREKTCIAMCSGQAITLGDDGSARLRAREVHPLRRMHLELRPHAPRQQSNVDFGAGSGGLHSAEN